MLAASFSSETALACLEKLSLPGSILDIKRALPQSQDKDEEEEPELFVGDCVHRMVADAARRYRSSC